MGELVMAVYCKKCEYRGHRTENGYAGSWKYPACDHSACFVGAIEEEDSPMGRFKKDNRSRITDMDELNKNNDCSHFEIKIGIVEKIFGKKDAKKTKKPRSKDDQILLLGAGLGVKKRELAVATGAVTNLKEEIRCLNIKIRKQNKLIKKQNNIIFNRDVEIDTPKIEPKKQFVRYIDLED
jgi:hypothetical protein